MKTFGKVVTMTTAVGGWRDFLVNGAIFLGSAAITYTIDNVTKLDFGTNTALIATGIALGLKYVQNVLNGWLTPTPVPVPAPVSPTAPDVPVK